ncbi:MAG: putative lysine decarboxylase [Microgenomates group bacterium ADurb.Bin219]|nr:MAG: putative lysine decarboxylase [Microgenomates group bacterium ADurb.Bin219]HNP89051.1 LOG family protein [Candidatus Woesebacteria bacterium]
MIKTVTFFGYSESKPGDPEYDAAYKTAKLLASKGYHIVNGGGPGVMRAATEGAHAGGGKATVVSFVPKDMTHFEGRDQLNHADEEIMKENYLERTLELLNQGDIYVVFNGGTGTISEFGMAWGLARLYFGHHRPLILYGDWWHEIMESFGRNMLMREIELQVYRIVTTPEEVLEEVEKLNK